jgi:hypothetical protein
MKKCTTATSIGAFFRFPKELLTHPNYKKLSAEAMILYGLLLDRLCLSLKNGWLDQNGDVYIYFSREEAMKLFSCGPDKIARLFKELKEVHLVEKVQQGWHRPDKIYVGEILPDTNTRTEEQPSDTTRAMSHFHQGPQNSSVQMLANQRSQISDIQRSQISDIQRSQISDIQRSQISDTNKTYLSNTDLSNTELNNTEKKNTHTDLPEGYRDPEDNERSNRTPNPRTYQPSKTQPVCEKTVALEQLQKDIQTVIGETIVIPRLARLVQSSSLERIRYHLEHWPIHKLNQVRPGAGYFLTVVENDIPPVAPPQKPLYINTGKVSQRDNFEQRDYSDEFLESFYVDLAEEEPISLSQAEPELQASDPGEQQGSRDWAEFLRTQEEQAKLAEYYAYQMRPRTLPQAPLLLDTSSDKLSEEAVQEDVTKHVPDDEDKFPANLVEEEETTPPFSSRGFPAVELPVCELLPNPFLDKPAWPPTAPTSLNVHERESDP